MIRFPISATAVDLDAVRYMHRAPDGLVSFACKHLGELRPIGAVSMHQLRADTEQPWIPELLRQLLHDGFVGIQTMAGCGVRERQREVYRAEVIEGQRCERVYTQTVRQRRVPGRNGLYFARHESSRVKWLEESFVDLDGYRVGLDGPATLAALMREYERGAIPMPSYVLQSGRGVWAKWRLVDDRNPVDPHASVTLHGSVHRWDTPLRGSPLAMDRWRRVQDALVAKLSHVGADSAAVDAARWNRIPGSIHSGTGKRVALLFPDAERIPLYTLEDLAGVLGIALQQPGRRADLRLVPTPAGPDAVTAAKRERGRAGYRGVGLKVFTAVKSLGRLRSGFKQRHRNAAILFMASGGLRGGLAPDVVLSECIRVGESCQPAYPSSDVRGTFRSIQLKMQRARESKQPLKFAFYQTIADRLRMTPEERRAVGLVPRVYAASRPKPSARREVVQSIIAESGGVVPASSVMQARLAARGFSVAPKTVRQDYKALGLHSGHAGGRPKPSRLFNCA